MQQRVKRSPSDMALERPSAARCYDYYLGGAYNFGVDRELAKKVERAVPNVREAAQTNRAFLRRAVRFCVDRGIRQFLDIGSGIPTVGNVHEIAQAVDPASRVVYVDNEPAVLAHSEPIIARNELATMVLGDLVDVDEVVDKAEATRLLDLSEPVAVLMVSLVHFVPDSWQPREVLRRYHERMAPGSYLAFSHVTGDHYPKGMQGLINLYETTRNPVTSRSRAQMADLLSDFELVEPGLVYAPEWRPESPEDVWPEPEKSMGYGAVGRKV
jgi:SAM-dependent methyltransferase